MRLTTRSTIRNCLQLPPRSRSGDVISRVRNTRSVCLLITGAWSGLPPTNPLIEDRQDGHLSWMAMISILFTDQVPRMVSPMRLVGVWSTALKKGGKITNLLSTCSNRGNGFPVTTKSRYFPQFIFQDCDG